MRVGTVVALWRYPVKSMAAEALDEVDVSWHGLAGDRRWAFVRAGMAHSGFPWLTIRQRPDLWHYRPRFVRPDRPDASPTVVRTPSGADLDVLDPVLAAELGAGVRVLKLDRGAFDALPLSLVSTRALTGIEALRLRPNLLVDAAGGGSFPEDGWVGRVLRIGGLRTRVDARDKRCVVVNVDPVTARRDPSVLRTIARERGGYLGVYGSTVEPGRVRLGDPVTLG